MMRGGFVPVVFVGIAIAISGCAAIITGTSQSIAINSQPDGAECTLTRERQTIGKLTTPGSVTISRSTQAIYVVCTKDGYEEARTVMNSLVESSTHLNALVGGVVGMIVDQTSGASNRYEASAILELTPLSPADQAAAAQPATRPKTQPSPSAVAAAPGKTAPPMMAVAKPSSETPAGPYDGTYAGSTDVLQTSVSPPVPHKRDFVVQVRNGLVTGTVKHPLCDQPGEVFLVIDTSGAVRGKANTQNTTGCTERMTMVDGRMDGSEMRLKLSLQGRPSLVLTQMSTSAAAPVPVAAQKGSFDGDYSGGVELGSGNLRRIWLRVIGTKATGTARLDACRKVGAIALDIGPDGNIIGDADLLDGPACGSKKASVKGRIDGKRLLATFTYQDGGTSREFAFVRQHSGVGIDD